MTIIIIEPVHYKKDVLGKPYCEHVLLREEKDTYPICLVHIDYFNGEFPQLDDGEAVKVELTMKVVEE